MERGNLIHAIQGLHNNVEVLDKETDVFAFPSMPQRIVAFLPVIPFLGQFQALFQDHVKMSHGEVWVGLEELVCRIEGPVIVIDDLMAQVVVVIKGPYVVASCQTVAEDLDLFSSR